MAYVEIEDPRPHVRVIRLNRPERMNAMSFDVMVPFREAIDAAAADNDVWAVIITGTGRGFCSGADLEDSSAPPNIGGLTLAGISVRAMEYLSDLVVAMRQSDKPVIAAINGAAVGGGMCLSLGADIRLAVALGVLPRRGHQQRTHRNRAGGELPAPAGDRLVPSVRDPALRPRRRRRRGRAHRTGVAGGRRRRAARRGLRPRGPDQRVQPRRGRAHQAGAVVGAGDRQPRGRDQPREPHAAAPCGSRPRTSRRRSSPAAKAARPSSSTDFSRFGVVHRASGPINHAKTGGAERSVGEVGVVAPHRSRTWRRRSLPVSSRGSASSTKYRVGRLYAGDVLVGAGLGARRSRRRGRGRRRRRRPRRGLRPVPRRARSPRTGRRRPVPPSSAVSITAG